MVKVTSLFLALLVSISANAENRVSVIDTGLNIEDPKYKPYLCRYGHKDFTGFGISDNDGHGTAVVDLIIENAKSANFCLVILKFFDPLFKHETTQTAIDAAKRAVLLQSKVVNMSLSGEGYVEEEKRTLASSPGTIFVVAAGNDSVNLDIFPRYPASYNLKNIMVVGALDPDTGDKRLRSNFGTKVVNWELATSTSYATAIKTGKLVFDMLGGRQ